MLRRAAAAAATLCCTTAVLWYCHWSFLQVLRFTSIAVVCYYCCDVLPLLLYADTVQLSNGDAKRAVKVLLLARCTSFHKLYAQDIHSCQAGSTASEEQPL